MQGLSLVCAMTLSFIESGYRLEWNEGVPAPPVFQTNHQSTHLDPEFIEESIRTGLAQGTMKEG